MTKIHLVDPFFNKTNDDSHDNSNSCSWAKFTDFLFYFILQDQHEFKNLLKVRFPGCNLASYFSNIT